MEILHTTGIHKQVGDPKKVRKKVPPFAPPQKGEIGGLTFFNFFLFVENIIDTAEAGPPRALGFSIFFSAAPSHLRLTRAEIHQKIGQGLGWGPSPRGACAVRPLPPR